MPGRMARRVGGRGLGGRGDEDAGAGGGGEAAAIRVRCAHGFLLQRMSAGMAFSVSSTLGRPGILVESLSNLC